MKSLIKRSLSEKRWHSPEPTEAEIWFIDPHKKNQQVDQLADGTQKDVSSKCPLLVEDKTLQHASYIQDCHRNLATHAGFAKNKVGKEKNTFDTKLTK